MENPLWKLLLVEDDEEDYILTRKLLEEARPGSFEIKWVRNSKQALLHLDDAENWDAILVDYALERQNGLDFLKQAVQCGCTIPIIFLTGQVSYRLDVEAMRLGAYDFLNKSQLNSILLERTIRYAIERRHAEDALRQVQDELERRVQERTEELKKANERLAYQAYLLQNINDAVIASDQNFMVTSWNHAAEQVYGWSAEEAIGKPVYDLIRPDLLNGEINEAINQIKEKGQFSAEVISYHRNGTPVMAEVKVTSLIDESGKPFGYLSVNRDITKRKKAEEMLRQSEARFRAIFEDAAIGIDLLDQNGQILAGNQAFQDFLGYSNEELSNKTFRDLISPEDLPDSEQLFNDLLAGAPGAYLLEKHYVRKDGSLIWGRQMLSLVNDDQGKPQFIIAMVENIQERKEMEAELAEVHQRLMESLEAERLNISQEIHDNPIQLLYGLTYQLHSYLEEASDEWKARIEATEKIIQDIISALRSLSGELRPPTLFPYGLEKTIRSHAEQFRQEHPEIQVDLNLDQDHQYLPEQTRLALFRIYQNAMSNVVRHSQASHIDVRFRIEYGSVKLEIQDDGLGFNVPSRWISLVRQGHLGLAGMAERAEAIGGKLEVDSKPGKGTTVRVTVLFHSDQVLHPASL